MHVMLALLHMILPEHHGTQNPHRRAQVQQQNSYDRVVVSGSGDIRSIYDMLFMNTADKNLT